MYKTNFIKKPKYDQRVDQVGLYRSAEININQRKGSTTSFDRFKNNDAKVYSRLGVYRVFARVKQTIKFINV